jgi:hypothetical protein
VLYDEVFDEVLWRDPQDFDEGLTLGGIVKLLGAAVRGRPRFPDGQDVLTYLLELNVDLKSVRATVEDLWQLNVQFPIPAAHCELVPQWLWMQGRAFILDLHTGVLPRPPSVRAGRS